ncbi:MAG: hypothetical protein HFG39_08210 [Lachnospiraceae bacterium]|nr:hypothetical protein [Lachnospiraceae bacterium]
MDEWEIKIAFWTLIVSSILNLITIGCNIYWNSISKKEKKKLENFVNIRDTILKYYLPIKYNLLGLELIQIKIKENTTDFDIFSLYTDNSMMRSLREELLTKYREYINIYSTLEIKYADQIIDKKLDEVYTHIYFILTVDNQRSLYLHKEKYKMPCLSDLIDTIDTYSINNKVF